MQNFIRENMHNFELKLPLRIISHYKKIQNFKAKFSTYKKPIKESYNSDRLSAA
ncbi:hypothetical protein LEP1GSC175_3034 [Leptospira santarosai str. HAI821]|nr:hypothetical protein LEP1GSC165_3123 [Leptospira santarosai str. CBC523]EMO31940.1 hypothetical protein LEP1GSC175_3034 [Leptospira santarosai str. HAI821]